VPRHPWRQPGAHPQLQPAPGDTVGRQRLLRRHRALLPQQDGEVPGALRWRGRRRLGGL